MRKAKPIFKAFAKHLKLEAQQRMLAAEAFAMVAGTPHRLAALCAAGALRLDRLRLIVVDVCLDAKQMCGAPGPLSLGLAAALSSGLATPDR